MARPVARLRASQSGVRAGPVYVSMSHLRIAPERADELIAAFRDYMRSEAHRISHDRIAHDLQSEIKLERLDHLHTYDVVAR